jgi:AraC-like DNA-binding protein
LELSDGAVPIGELAAELGWSRRHLAVRFREELGMAPKALARLLRFERAVKRLRAGDELADLALDAGYYDQAHFNRDFRAFAGTTPTQYLAV